MSKSYIRKGPAAIILPRSTSFRINMMFSLPSSQAKMSIAELRELRDIAARDGDLTLAFKAASAIDRKRAVQTKHRKKKNHGSIN